ncbi:hypothetical protein RM549_09465 [Salegentibacter sp. F188]|uniref:Outer membrane protein beta-barrel domain-containing protein n=1 Tax=Autumnicola patrickiae TaxID=3075591 RepID=A0ABU3E1Z4_9FLAO|nr:hypothetical protein [Salegentibacter sp. F188]MDT0690011.1 hypothetical protein [Salegentibacter sp. F188]
MKKAIQVSIVTLFLIFSSVLSAQEVGEQYYFSEDKPKVRPFRIGGKLGFPNLIGGNLEYVTPLLGDKLAVSVDYSTIKSDWFAPEEEEGYEESGDKIDYTYMEGGLNYYLFSPGKGLYVGASYGTIRIDGEMMFYSENSDRTDPGTADIDLTNSSFSVKLGAKLGGLFYFRPEVGYRFTPLPKDYETVVVFNDGYTETRQTPPIDTESSPQNLLYKGLIANIGLGFSF